MPTTLQTKFLEDLQGNKYAPVTTPNAVRWPDGSNLTDKLSVMGASGSGHASGLVPDTPTTAGNTKFLREDGTWAIPSGGSGGMEIVNLYTGPNVQPAYEVQCEVGKCYVDVFGAPHAFVLPAISAETPPKTKSVVMQIFTGEQPNISILGTASTDYSLLQVQYADGFSLEPNSYYEINCLFSVFNATELWGVWTISAIKVSALQQRSIEYVASGKLTEGVLAPDDTPVSGMFYPNRIVGQVLGHTFDEGVGFILINNFEGIGPYAFCGCPITRIALPEDIILADDSFYDCDLYLDQESIDAITAINPNAFGPR